MVNRAASGRYIPGSCFKPVVCMAILEGAGIDPPTFDCPGYFELGNSVMHCWYERGHGVLTMRQSLEHSCNVYFFNLALKYGYDVIYHMAAALGLGEKTGADVYNEASGLLPDDNWKRQIHGDAWRLGDTCNLSIGQGALTVTPLQMAVVASAFANHGHVFKPRMVLGTRGKDKVLKKNAPELANEMNWSDESLEIVRGGMRDVVMSRYGTGRLAKVPGVAIAGKTGTAEYGKKDSGLKYGWMIAFAPFDDPRYAIALVLDKSISGGATAAPRVREILNGLFNEDPLGGAG